MVESVTALSGLFSQLSVLLHKTRTTEIKAIIPGEGFQKVDIGEDCMLGRNATSEIFREQIKMYMELMNLDELIKQKINVSLIGDNDQITVRRFTFEFGVGNDFKLIFAFKKKENNKFDWCFCNRASNFVLAPKKIVMHYEKKSFFRNKSWDEIVTVPSDLNKETLKQLFEIDWVMFSHGLAAILN